MREKVAIVIVLLLLVPVASAKGADVAGELRAPVVRIVGPASFSASDGALDLADAVRRAEPLALAWSHAHGILVTTAWRLVTGPVGDPVSKKMEDPTPEPLAFDDARLVGLTCGDACQVLLVGGGAQGRVGLSGLANGALRWTTEDTLYFAEWSDGTPYSFHRAFPRGTLVASNGDLAGAVPLAEGRVGLFFKDAAAIVEGRNGTRTTLDARYERDVVAGAPGAFRVEDVWSRFAYLELDAASLDAAPGTAARFLAERADVSAHDALDAEDATGRLRFAGRTIDLADQPVRIEGDLSLRLGTADRLPGAAPGPLDGTVAEATVQGEATRVQVGDAVLAAPRDAPVAAAAVGLTGLAALVAVVASLFRFPWAAFYSRISPARLLANPNRAALYDLICREPGVTQADLRRRTGLARVVVAHHLRLLEAHRHVKRRRDGRRSRYFSASALPDDASLTARFALQDGSRRKVVDALAGSAGGLTQRELAEATRLSQRLVSYHLRRLEDAGLVRPDGSAPRRYGLRR